MSWRQKSVAVQSNIDGLLLDKAVEFFGEECEKRWCKLAATVRSPRSFGRAFKSLAENLEFVERQAQGGCDDTAPAKTKLRTAAKLSALMERQVTALRDEYETQLEELRLENRELRRALQEAVQDAADNQARAADSHSRKEELMAEQVSQLRDRNDALTEQLSRWCAAGSEAAPPVGSAIPNIAACMSSADNSDSEGHLHQSPKTFTMEAKIKLLQHAHATKLNELKSEKAAMAERLETKDLLLSKKDKLLARVRTEDAACSISNGLSSGLASEMPVQQGIEECSQFGRADQPSTSAPEESSQPGLVYQTSTSTPETQEGGCSTLASRSTAESPQEASSEVCQRRAEALRQNSSEACQSMGKSPTPTQECAVSCQINGGTSRPSPELARDILSVACQSRAEGSSPSPEPAHDVPSIACNRRRDSASSATAELTREAFLEDHQSRGAALCSAPELVREASLDFGQSRGEPSSSQEIGQCGPPLAALSASPRTLCTQLKHWVPADSRSPQSRQAEALEMIEVLHTKLREMNTFVENIDAQKDLISTVEDPELPVLATDQMSPAGSGWTSPRLDRSRHSCQAASTSTQRAYPRPSDPNTDLGHEETVLSARRHDPDGESLRMPKEAGSLCKSERSACERSHPPAKGRPPRPALTLAPLEPGCSARDAAVRSSQRGRSFERCCTSDAECEEISVCSTRSGVSSADGTSSGSEGSSCKHSASRYVGKVSSLPPHLPPIESKPTHRRRSREPAASHDASEPEAVVSARSNDRQLSWVRGWQPDPLESASVRQRSAGPHLEKYDAGVHRVPFKCAPASERATSARVLVRIVSETGIRCLGEDGIPPCDKKGEKNVWNHSRTAKSD